jgi:hypothetical protein
VAVFERRKRVKRRRDSGEEEGMILVAVLVSKVKGRNQRRRFPVEEVTDGEEDADRWAPPVRGREGKNGSGMVVGPWSRFSAGPDRPFWSNFFSFPFFLLSFYSFLFSELNQIFCKTPSNQFKQNSKFF